jgi:hypothetical protein
MNNLTISFDNKTPKGNNKFDSSPNNNLTIPGFKTPANQFVFRPDEDNSKGFQAIMNGGDDFGSKCNQVNSKPSFINLSIPIH